MSHPKKRVNWTSRAELVGLVAIAVGGIVSTGCQTLVTEAPVAESSAKLVGDRGDVTITAANTVLNGYAGLGAPAAAGATTLTLTTASLTVPAQGAVPAHPVQPGDLLLVMQMQGADINTTDTPAYGTVSKLNGTGSYEFVYVGKVTATTIELDAARCGALRNSYAAGGKARSQVVLVPQPKSLTITAGASLVAKAWNGTTGGIVAVQVQGQTTLTGNIDASGRGFRGGTVEQNTSLNSAVWVSADETKGAYKGESIAGFLADLTGGAIGRGAPANGGGGGNAHNAGGGGGALVASPGIAYTGRGVFDPRAPWLNAWLLELGGLALPVGSSGGGRGGYTFSANNQDALTLAPGVAAWGGDQRREHGGYGGHPLNPDPASQLFLSGGGGAGDSNNDQGGAGGPGGGIAFLLSRTVTGAGSILANGAAGLNTVGPTGNNDAPGGGGGGGTIIVQAESVAATVKLLAHGGVGGNQLTITNEAEGPGGGGGGGFIAVNATGLTFDVVGGANGTSASTAVTEFLANGATSGGGGLTATSLGTLPFCSAGGLTLKLTDGLTDTQTAKPAQYTLTLRNDGLTTLSGRALTLPVPTGVAAASWTCSPAAACGAVAGSGGLSDTPTLAPGNVVTYVLSATVTALLGATVTATATLAGTPDVVATDVTTVNYPNLPPVVTLPATVTATEDTPLVLTGATGIQVTDPDAIAAPIEVNLKATQGVLTLASKTGLTFTTGTGTSDTEVKFTGTQADITAALTGLVYQPLPNYFGAASIEVAVNDLGNSGFGGAQVATQTLSFNVTAVNDAPIAVPDAATTTDGTAVVIDPLANDTDVDGPLPLQLVSADAGAAGAVVIGTDGKLTFTPAAGHVGSIPISYRVSDGVGGFANGLITVTIGGADRDGDGLSDSFETLIGTNPDDADSDDDGALDGAETSPQLDSDGDGLINALDSDSDNDGLFDGTELGFDCANAATSAAAKHCRADGDLGATKTDPLDRDTDGGGVTDGSEDANLDGVVDTGETNPNAGNGADDSTVVDTDGDGLSDKVEKTLGSNPNDADSDDDGLLDGAEPNPGVDVDGDGLIDVLDADSDGDGLFDGTEMGQSCANPATDKKKNRCVPDADGGKVKTSPILADTDRGGVSDGEEDTNRNGRLDNGERDPNLKSDDLCVRDAQCGAADSAKVCGKAGKCEPGCRGKDGNSCPSNQTCSSSTAAVGTCQDNGTGGSASTGGATGTGAAPATGGASATGGSTTTTNNQDAALEGGGFSCRTAPAAPSKGAWGTLGLLLGGLILRRNTRNRRAVRRA